MPRFVTQDDMNLIFAVVDQLGISREAIKVPLQPKDEGSVTRLDNAMFHIVVPADSSVADWTDQLRSQLQRLLG